MTSRQRILAALNHQPVDRIPVDIDGTGQSGIAAMAYRKLRRHLGLSDELQHIKSEIGDRITLGGASGDCQNKLTTGSPEAVREETLHHLDTLHPLEGGVVWAGVHNIQANVPPENIVALLDVLATKNSIHVPPCSQPF